MKKLLLVVFVLPALLASAQQGILDVSFGSGIPAGTEQISNPSTGFYEKAIAFQSDGKIVISTGGGMVSIGRLKTDGSQDPYFGSAGWKNLGNYAVGSIAVQSDGKILATGKPTVVSYQDQYIWRLNSDASFDPTFGQNGKVSDTTLGGGNEHLALLSGGQIMWSGTNGFRKLNSDGTTDITWANNGRLLSNQLPIYVSNIIADTLSGYVIASGVTKTQSNIAIIRITPTGQVDATFGYGGIDSLDYSVNVLGYAQDLKFSPAGKIVLGADYTDGSYDHVLCAQFNSDGTRDLNFGTNGIVIPNWNAPNNEAFLGGIGVQQDERIVFVCSSRDTTVGGFYYDILTQRINTNGTSDAAYGITRLDISQANDLANAAAIDADGKLVLVGKSGGSQLLARYTDGTTNILSQQNPLTHIYPNPAKDVFTFERALESNSVLEIADLSGRIVKSLKLPAQVIKQEIDIRSLSPGAYFLRLNNGLSEVYAGTLIIE